MKKINNVSLKNKYIDKYGLNNFFTNDMSEYMELILFEKNDYICKESEKMNYLYFFVEGKAKVYVILKNGKSLLLCFYYPMTVLGDLELVNNCDTTTNIQVLRDSYCIAIDLSKVRENLLLDAKFLRYACDSLGGKLQTSSNNSSINLLYPLENRLASYIMAAAEEVIINNKEALLFNENLTEIAELLGTSYRHLLRTLNNLRDKGAIIKSNSGYIIENKNILSMLAADLYK